MCLILVRGNVYTSAQLGSSGTSENAYKRLSENHRTPRSKTLLTIEMCTEGVFLQYYATANHPVEVAERPFRQSQGAVPRTRSYAVFDEHRVGTGRDKSQ